MNVQITLAESGWIPDPLLRLGIRRLCARRLEEERASGADGRLADLADRLRRSPIALHTDLANQQHYEVPPAFFRSVLGPRLKYSCCAWDEGVRTLAEAEDRMLAATCERAGIMDGMRVLDLGCGWGSLALYLASRHPDCRVVAVSNSKLQGEHILGECALRGLSNVEVVTADVNRFEPGAQFDRVVSVEMFEHVRNWEQLFARIARWLTPEGAFLQHVFCHHSLAYLFEDRGDDDWMARHFFSGGLMPAVSLPLHFQRDLETVQQWRIDGTHYARTAEAWLRNLDSQRAMLTALLGPLAVRRWRLFFLACAELFGFRRGTEWGVVHTLMAPGEKRT